MSQTMSINTEVVAAAANRVSVNVADVKTRMTKFRQLLDEKNNATQGKFPLIKSLQVKIEDEVKNVTALEASIEEINAAINKYTALAEEAADDSVWN